MASTSTRMLLLGAVQLFEPVNGYQIRRELVSWEIDKWAHVNPGSIYHGLTTLAGQGLLERHDLRDGTRDVAVYEITAEGRSVLDAMLVEALETVDPYDRVPFHIAFGMLPLVPKAQVVTSLTARRVALELAVADFVRGADDPMNGPPHARRGWVLWMDLAVAELGWLREVVVDIREGRLKFSPGEDWGWSPPPEDEGWQMGTDREKYRALLGR